MSGTRSPSGIFSSKSWSTSNKDIDQENTVLLKKDSISENPPDDPFKLTYIILFLHGIGHLLPWNMFITAHEYFEHRFTCPENHGNKSHSCHGFSDSFENYFSIVSTTSTVISCALNIYLQSRISFQYRMFASLVMTLLLFVVTTVMVKVPSEEWVDEFFALTIFTILVIGLFSGIFQSSTFGFAGMLPPGYITAVMKGQACAGVFSSVVRIISTVAANNSDITLAALIYFLAASAVTFLCLLSFFVLIKLNFVQFHLQRSSVKALRQKQESNIKGSVNILRKSSLPFFSIFMKVLVYGVSVFLVFTVSIGLFPAVVSNINSNVLYPKATIWTGSLFDALICFLIFNCADLAGRYLSNWCEMTGKWRYLLLVLTILRFLFVPLFLMCNVQPRSDRFPVLLTSDIWPVAINTLFGLTNGLFASLAMVSAPSCVSGDYRETASVIMTWFLTLGLFTGAVLSFLFTYIIRA